MFITRETGVKQKSNGRKQKKKKKKNKKKIFKNCITARECDQHGESFHYTKKREELTRKAKSFTERKICPGSSSKNRLEEPEGRDIVMRTPIVIKARRGKPNVE